MPLADNIMTDPVRGHPQKQDMTSFIPKLKECIICITKAADAVIMLCGHGGLCFDCGQILCQSKVNPRCYLCRKVRIFGPNSCF
jgi:hypothetical protein